MHWKGEIESGHLLTNKTYIVRITANVCYTCLTYCGRNQQLLAIYYVTDRQINYNL